MKKNKLIGIVKVLIIFCILIIVVLGVVIVSMKNLNTEDKIADEKIETQSKAEQIENAKKAEESVVINKLADMKERDRIEYYFSVFIKAIENKNYEKAYEMLYEQFRNNYFPTLSEFEELVKL